MKLLPCKMNIIVKGQKDNYDCNSPALEDVNFEPNFNYLLYVRKYNGMLFVPPNPTTNYNDKHKQRK